MQGLDYLLALRAKDDESKTEMESFVEEQNIRRSLGPATFQNFCDLIETECGHVNKVSADRLLIERSPLSISIRDSRSAKLLNLEYDEKSACIHYEQSGRSSSNIVFRVDKTPAPSLMPMYNGMPHLLAELALTLVVGLTR